MEQGIKLPGAKPDDLNSIPGTHREEDENCPRHAVFWFSHAHYNIGY